MFGGSLSVTEQETAHRELATVSGSLERASKGVYDNIQIAGSLIRVRDEHGENSAIYSNYLNAVKDNCVGWEDKRYRANVSHAYRGFEAMSGSEEDKQFIWKMKPSLSALGAVLMIAPSEQYKFRQELKDLEKFPTAAAVEKFAQKGVSMKPKTTSTTTPSQPYQFNQSYSAPPTGDTVSTSSQVVSCEVVNPIEQLPMQQHVAEGFEIERAPSTDIEKLAKAVEYIKSIRDLDSLYADTAAINMVMPVSHELEVLSSMTTPVSTRKYV